MLLEVVLGIKERSHWIIGQLASSAVGYGANKIPAGVCWTRDSNVMLDCDLRIPVYSLVCCVYFVVAHRGGGGKETDRRIAYALTCVALIN